MSSGSIFLDFAKLIGIYINFPVNQSFYPGNLTQMVAFYFLGFFCLVGVLTLNSCILIVFTSVFVSSDFQDDFLFSMSSLVYIQKAFECKYKQEGFYLRSHYPLSEKQWLI